MLSLRIPKCYPICCRHTLTLDSTETRIILFGGQQLGAAEKFFYLNDLHVFDVETLEWFTPKVTTTACFCSCRVHHVIVASQVGGKLPPPRAFHSSYVVDTKVPSLTSETS